MAGYDFNVQPAPIESPMGAYGKMMQIRQAQQGYQVGQVELQQKQQELKDDQTFRTSMQDPALRGKTIGEVADTLAASGNLSPAGWAKYKQLDITQRKDTAALTKDELDNRAKAHEATQQLYNNVMNLPDDQLQQSWPQIAQQYNSIPGNQKQPLDPNQPQSKQQLQQFAPLIDMNSAYLSQEAARRKAENEAKASGYKGEGGVLYDVTGSKPVAAAGNPPVAQQVLSSWLNAKEANGKTRAENGKTAVDYQQAAETKTESTSSDLFGTNTVHRSAPTLATAGGGVAAAQPKAAIVPPAKPNSTTPPKNISATPVDIDPSGRNEAALQGLKPGDAAAIKAIADYRLNPQQFMRRPGVLAKVAEYDPTFDQQIYQLRQQTRRYFTTGKGSEEVQAFNTAQQHADLLQKAYDALQNGDNQTLNSLKNSWATAFGSGLPTSTQAIIDAYNHEVNTAIAKGHTTDKEISSRSATLSANSNPDTVSQVLGQYKNLMQSKIRIRMNQYEAGLRGMPAWGNSVPGGSGPTLTNQNQGGGQRPPLSSFEK